MQKLNAKLEDSGEPLQEFDEESASEEELIDRHNLLERYGLKDMDETDVEELLGTQDSSSLDNKELENMERVLAKRIYQAIMSIPAIKKVAVEVFMEISDELYGIVNIIVEYEPKGFLDRIIGISSGRNVETIEVAQMELIEVFESYPEVVENFEINIESF